MTSAIQYRKSEKWNLLREIAESLELTETQKKLARRRDIWQFPKYW